MAGAPEGNTNAAKDSRLITNALRRVVTQSPDKLRAACEKVLEDAQNGNLAAFNVIADRLDGKPPQSLDIGNKDGESFDITSVGMVPLTRVRSTDTST